ncbi:hypothetical protein ATCC90586_005604 [Pythium insidiosum]|nr:hypothetical protein ATCC90586_005604 [Pythium insidiosum]
MKLVSSFLAVSSAVAVVSATNLITTNKCDFQVKVWDNHVGVDLNPGQTYTRFLPMGWKGMFRHGVDPRATLGEFTMDGGKAWYDISIIPTGIGKGPDLCPSLEECKRHTGGWGYNVPMAIVPRSNVNGAHCRPLECKFDGCPDAYQFPKDDTKTHNCPYGTDFDLVFCPGGKGGETPAPTPPPTTTAPPTQPPTPAPTPEPTPSPTPEPTPTPTPTPEPTNSTLLLSDAQNEAGVIEERQATEVPTSEPTTSVNAINTTPQQTTSAPAVFVNTKNQAAGTSAAGVILTVCVALAVVGGVAVIVIARRKKAELESMEDKNSIMLRDSHAAL